MLMAILGLSLLLAKDCPADEGDSTEQLVEQRGYGEDRSGQDEVHRPRGQCRVGLHHVTETADN